MAAGYLATSWLLVQVIETLLPVFGFSENAVRYTVIEQPEWRDDIYQDRSPGSRTTDCR